MSLCSAGDIRSFFRSDREVTSALFHRVVTAEETHSLGHSLNSDKGLDAAFDTDTSPVSLGRAMELFFALCHVLHIKSGPFFHSDNKKETGHKCSRTSKAIVWGP